MNQRQETKQNKHGWDACEMITFYTVIKKVNNNNNKYYYIILYYIIKQWTL